MNQKYPAFEDKDCVSCGICVQSCPLSCLSMTRQGKQGKYKNLFPALNGEGCTGCGLCQRACPMACIHMEQQAQQP